MAYQTGPLVHTIIELGSNELIAFAAVVSLLGLAFSAAFAALPDDDRLSWSAGVHERFVALSWSVVGTTPEGDEWTGVLPRILLWTFALVVNVLLVQGFLIALVGDIKTKVDQQAKAESDINRISVFLEFKDKGAVPPPFNILRSLAIVFAKGSYNFKPDAGVASDTSDGITKPPSTTMKELKKTKECEHLLMKKYMNSCEKAAATVRNSGYSQPASRRQQDHPSEQLTNVHNIMMQIQEQMFELKTLLERRETDSNRGQTTGQRGDSDMQKGSSLDDQGHQLAVIVEDVVRSLRYEVPGRLPRQS